MPPVSILQTLGILPSGAQGPALDLSELGQYLARFYNDDHAKEREQRHTLRDELYRDGGVRHMENLIDQVFTDPDTRELRKRWVKYARFANPIKRITNQLSTVYAEPAERIIEGDAVKMETLYEAVRMHERMLEASRLLNLHRAIAIGFRVRELADGTREPALDIATPGNARPIVHPTDATLVIGWLIRTAYRSARPDSNIPAWVLWTDYESVQLRDNFSVIGGTYQTHPFGVCPWFGITLGAPQPGFFSGCEGEDLVAAHLAIWFSHVLLLKESKSATKVAPITGDGTMTARGQALDTEIPPELQDGQSVTVHDLSMDLGMFRDTTDHVLTHAGLNHEIPPAMLSHQGTQSAEARDLLRLPIKELRKQQAIPWRRAEKHLAVVMAAVLAVDMPELAFDASTFLVRFIEAETPLDPETEHRLFLERRAAGLDNSVAFIKRTRPGVTDVQALELLEENINVELARNVLMRPLQAISGSLGAETPEQTDAPAADDAGSTTLETAPDSSTETPAEPTNEEPAGGGGSGAPPKEALNGAQVTSLVEVITAVAAGTLSRQSGQKILELAFLLGPTEAVALLGPEGFKPAVEVPASAPPTAAKEPAV